MNALERRFVIERLSAWLGPGLYDQRLDVSYCREVERVLDASLGELPRSSSAQARLDHFAVRWNTFTTLADSLALRWTAAHRSADRPVLTWPSRGISSRIEGLAGSAMRPALDLNRASADELVDLPGIGPATARRIVARRLANGRYTALDDLRHVRGLAKADRDKAAPFLTVGTADSAPMAIDPVLAAADGRLDFPALLRRLHAIGATLPGWELPPGAPQRSASSLALLGLQRLADECRRARLWERDRRADVTWLRLLGEAHVRVQALTDRAPRRCAVGVLRNSDYLTVMLGLIDRARTQVRVQMFFLSSPGETSPGDRLIDALVSAATRGVSVRLIIDTDLEDDYHGASRVNAESIARLQATGLAYRFDELGTTSHSKAVLVDDDQVVIGSHNWTTSGMYLLDETSLYLESAAVAADEIQRFERRWKRYDPDPDSRDLHFSLVAFLLPFERRRLAAEGLEGSRAFLDRLDDVAAVEALAAGVNVDAARLLRLWRVLTLMHAFGFPEETAFALTLTPVDSPDALRNTPRAETLEHLRKLGPLPDPYARRRIRFDVVEAADG